MLWPKRGNHFFSKLPFWPILLLKVTCVFGPINGDSFGPNGRFPGTFWPKPSHLGCLRSLKKLGQNSRWKNFYDIFNFGRFCRYNLVMGLAGPQNRPKTPTEAKKRVLVITLARGGVTGRSTPPFTCTMEVFDRFRRVRDPNGTTLTTFGPPRRAGRARKFFRSGVPRVPKKKIFPKDFFCSKTLFIGS